VSELSILGLSGNEITDLVPLVDNPGLGDGDEIDLRDNPLDLSSGSEGMDAIETLKERGALVDYGE
jgi:hypothetical protein